ELRLELVALFHAALCDYDHLAKPAVGCLQIERKDEPRSAGADVGRPMIDAIISLQLLPLEPRDLRVCFRDRGVLWQIPVDDEFAAVRGRKELLLHECHSQ